MQWLKTIMAILPTILEIVKERQSDKKNESNNVASEFAKLRYIPIKTYDDNDPEYVKQLAKISKNDYFRYFIFDWKERAIQDCNNSPNHVDSIQLMNALTRLQIALREKEAEAIAMEAHNV